MSDVTPLREAVDALAERALPPDFSDLERRVARRRHRRVAVVAAVTAAVLVGSALGVAGLGDERRTAPVDQLEPSRRVTNGWVAVDTNRGGGDIYLLRPGGATRRLDVAGWEGADDACPAWSPDGARLMLGRLPGSSDGTSRDAELVIVPVDQGTAHEPLVIGLDGFGVLGSGPEGFDAHPCGIWASDGRWVALTGTGQVWVVDTRTGAIRRLPDLRPSDLAWRPGTDELAIAGDVGTDRAAPTLATPVSVYSVSTGELRQLGSVEAAHLTWSPDGATLAYTGGEPGPSALRLVEADGTDGRSLVADLGQAIHGIGPVWSPTGDRIAYQRCQGGPDVDCSGEGHEVVLVDVADGNEAVIAPPRVDGHEWYPFTVTWSPDGTTLLYTGWGMSEGQASPIVHGVVAVPVDVPRDASVLTDDIQPVPGYYSHRWTPTQMWGRQPG